MRLYNMPLAARNQNNRQDANALRADREAGTGRKGGDAVANRCAHRRRRAKVLRGTAGNPGVRICLAGSR